MNLKQKYWPSRVLAACGAFVVFFSVVITSFSQGVLPGETVGTNPKERPVEITATVVPPFPPPYPVLIEPHNNKILRSGVVLFQWYGVDHPIPIDRYELHLNGKMYFPRIHPVNQTTDDYILTYDAVNNVYSLRLQQDKWLPDGVYTWKIRVVDVNDRGSDSTTWTFTVDSTPPPIIVTEIDDDPYAISATDPTTFPSEPIVVNDRSPLIKGKSETGSELEVIVRYPDGTVWQTYTTTVAQDGSFQVQLGNLPVDVVMHLTFTAIDPANNSTVLDAIDLVYRPPEIVIPIPDIFPFPLTIRIRIPGKIIDLPEIPEIFPPKEVPDFEDQEASAVPPTEQVFTRPVQPRGLLVLGAWLGLGWYVMALFWITGNPWSWLRYFLQSLVKLWIFWVGPEREWQFMRLDSGETVPFLAYTIRFLTNKKQYNESFNCTSLNGYGRTELLNNALIHVQTESKRFVYSLDPLSTGANGQPSSTTVSFSEKTLALDGEDFLFSEQTTQVKQIDEHSVLLPVGTPCILLQQSIRSEQLRRWQIWLPQIGLWLGVVSALWLAYVQPTWWGFALLVLVLWVAFRDATVQMHKKMSVYAQR